MQYPGTPRGSAWPLNPHNVTMTVLHLPLALDGGSCYSSITFTAQMAAGINHAGCLCGGDKPCSLCLHTRKSPPKCSRAKAHELTRALPPSRSGD